MEAQLVDVEQELQQLNTSKLGLEAQIKDTEVAIEKVIQVPNYS